MTFSVDGTTHRATAINVQHANYAVESYSQDNDTSTEHATRLLGVHSALDGTSEQSVKTWKELLAGIADIYNQSPLKKRQEDDGLLRVVDIFVKLTGIHSDHCAKEKKDARLLEKEKTAAVYQSLGEDAILGKSNEELLRAFIKARSSMIEAAGGTEQWEALPALTQAEHEANMMEKLVIELGKDAYQRLSDDEKRFLKLFIWAGCGCHKDLSTARSGNHAMNYGGAKMAFLDLFC